jgi:hypothetical protein
MLITPQKLAVKYSPPRLCLIYSVNSESFFHEFPVMPEDLKLTTEKLYKKLKTLNPGYLDAVDPEQVFQLLELMKNNANKPSKARKLRGIVSDYREDSKKPDHSNRIEDIDLLL